MLLIAAVLAAATGAPVEVVIGGIGDKRRLADIFRSGTACWRCGAAMRVQALNKGGCAQPVTAGGAILLSNDRHQKPGDCPGLDVIRVGVDVFGLGPAPDGARVLRVLPGAADAAIAYHSGIRVRLLRVGTKVVGAELLYEKSRPIP